jgi:hypothetical protein
MTSLEILWSNYKEAVENLWIHFLLPTPEHFNDITEEERGAILAVVSQWPSKYWEVFIAKTLVIDMQTGKRVCEDILSGIREIEESKLNDEIQEQEERNIPFKN